MIERAPISWRTLCNLLPNSLDFGAKSTSPVVRAAMSGNCMMLPLRQWILAVQKSADHGQAFSRKDRILKSVGVLTFDPKNDDYEYSDNAQSGPYRPEKSRN
jgi:hypothetical protein